MSIKALKDFTESKLSICEDRKADGYMRVRGPFQKAETRNANGRIYPSSLWERVLGDISVKNMLESRRMLGCVEHPSSGITSLAEVSHIVTGLQRQGNEIIGEAEILNTPSGLIIQELLRRGVPVGISSRGKGSSLMRNGVEYVNPDDFVLETFDFVYKPSTPGAFPELQESILADTPFSKNTPMLAKVDQIKKFDVRAGEISATSKPSLSDLHTLHKECVEMAASLEGILSSFTEAEATEHGKYATEVKNKIESARQAVSINLDKHYSRSDLDRRLESIEASSQGSDVMKTLLSEARQENAYLRSRLDELSTVLESSDDELQRRYSAAAQLAEETLDKLQELTASLDEVTQERDELTKRYEAAVDLVAQVQEAQATATMASLVQEAIDEYPALAKFTKTLNSCETFEELAERVEELVTGLGLGNQNKTESVIASGVKLTGAIKGNKPKVSQDLSERVDVKALRKGLTESADNKSTKRASGDQILESQGNSDSFTDDLLDSLGLS